MKSRKVLKPKVVAGGQAVPLGNNFYYMRGRKHKDGGIDVGENPRTGVEVEDGEVMHITPSEAKVFSAVPFINGESPAQKVMGGDNPNTVFKQQENYKDRNNLNDDGSKKKELGGKTMNRKKAARGTKLPIVRNVFQDIDPNTGLAINPATSPISSTPVFTERGTSFNPIDFSGNEFSPAVSSTGEVNQSNVAGASGVRKVLGNVGKILGRGYDTVAGYVRDNPADAIGIGANIVGGIVGNITNNRMLNSLRYSKQPVARQATKLKTTININPQLDKMRETVAAYERDIDNNTASSRVALARKQRGRLAGMLNTNELYGQKENMETQLINQDRFNQQRTSEANILDYNRWSEGKTQFENAVREKKSENTIGLIENINAGVQDVITRNERREANRQNALVMAAAHPNVNPRILRDLGVKVSDEDIKNWDKVYGKNKNKKKD